MKRIISVIIAVSLCISSAVLFSACGKNLSGKEEKAIKKEFESNNIGSNFNPDNVSQFSVEGENDKNDNKIYNDAADSTGFIINKSTGKVVSTGFVVKNALYKDVDGDGIEEVYVTGFDKLQSKTDVMLFGYIYDIFDFSGDPEKIMQVIATASFDGELNLGFFEDEKGNVHVASFNETTGEVDNDYGIAKCNGLMLEIGDYNTISEKAEDRDMSIFVTDKYEFYYNGKKFTPAKDFAWNDGSVIPVSYVEKEEFEKLIGQTYKASKGDDDRSIMEIYGKEYVSWITLTKNYKIQREMRNGLKEVHFMSLDYVEPEKN